MRFVGVPDTGAAFDRIELHEHQVAAMGALTQAITRRAGWVSLVGGYGCGKSTLLEATCRAAAAAGLDATLTTAAALQELLFAAMRDERLGDQLATLARVPVLAIDELDALTLSGPAEGWFNDLLGSRRYGAAGSSVTLLACNVVAAPIPPRLQSRMRDARFRLIDLGDVDLRAVTTPLSIGPWDRGEGER